MQKENFPETYAPGDEPPLLKASNALRGFVEFVGRWGAWFIVPLVLVTVLGVVSVFQPGPPRGFAVGAPVSSLDLMLGAGVLFIAFQGFEVVAQLSDQVKHPESSVPRGVFLALLLAFLVYGGFFLAVLGNMPSDKLTGWPGCAACLGGAEDIVLWGVRHFVGQPYVRVIVLIIGIVSMYGALNSNLTAAIKTSFSMARDRLLPGSFARIGGREVPPAAVALTYDRDDRDPCEPCVPRSVRVRARVRRRPAPRRETERAGIPGAARARGPYGRGRTEPRSRCALVELSCEE